MVKQVEKTGQERQVEKSTEGTPRCLPIAKAGITTANQFARFMSGLISDLIEGNIGPQVGNAAVNAGGKLLKVVEMQYKYGKTSQDGSPKSLDLTVPEQAA